MRYLLIVLLTASCNIQNAGTDPGNNREEAQIVPAVKASIHDSVIPTAAQYNKIPAAQLTEGVLTLKEHGKGLLRIYDFHNREWLSLKVDSIAPDSLKPYSCYPDYENLVFRVTRFDAEYYHVIVNEETGLTAKIRKSEPSLVFQRWDEHVISVFSVDFDADKNPVKQDTTGQQRAAYNNDVEFFFPVRTQGDWLEVRWDDDTKEKNGWIKWRNGNTLLIYLNYIA
ncbi:MAG: hypothetical protein ABW007_22375 [Chitinophagaceae bacterium]